MNNFLKILSIWAIVNKVVNAAVQAGGSVPLEPLMVQESVKSVQHAVNGGYLHPDVLEDIKEIVTELVRAHPDVKLFDEPKPKAKE